MDTERLASELEEAIHQAMPAGGAAIERVFKERKPDALTICLAHALCFLNNRTQANRDILSTRLQLVLMKEHVAAQKRMGRTLVWLNCLLVVLTVVLVALTLALVDFAKPDFGDKILCLLARYWQWLVLVVVLPWLWL